MALSIKLFIYLFCPITYVFFRSYFLVGHHSGQRPGLGRLRSLRGNAGNVSIPTKSNSKAVF